MLTLYCCFVLVSFFLFAVAVVVARKVCAILCRLYYSYASVHTLDCETARPRVKVEDQGTVGGIFITCHYLFIIYIPVQCLSTVLSYTSSPFFTYFFQSFGYFIYLFLP
jgi:hypothetical protein